MEIRAMADADVDAVLRINEESVWAVSPMDAEQLARYRRTAGWSLVCEVDGEVAAFVLAYPPGTSYESVNYRWHAERFEDFVYLDRIIVDPSFRRRGIASRIYDVVEAEATPHGRLVCEVYSTPPNVESLAFHKARGYRELGYLTQPNGHECVMLGKPL